MENGFSIMMFMFSNTGYLKDINYTFIKRLKKVVRRSVMVNSKTIGPLGWYGCNQLPTKKEFSW